MILAAAILICTAPAIVDGDTLRCGGERVRLLRIDAPELPGHCRQGRDCAPGDPYASTRALWALTRGEVRCEVKARDRYDRALAECVSGGRNLSDEMLRAGGARRYR